MKQATGVFQFDLSRAELFWLAGAFGISSLPLPDEMFKGLTARQLELQQKAGHASLLTRGLIRPSPGFGWQVERFPAALVQWISSAPFLLRIERISKDGSARSLHLFTSGAQGLSLEMSGDTVRFTIYQTRRLLQDALIRWLSLPLKIKKTTSAHKLPQPLAFFPVAWKDSALAASILKEHKMDSKTANSTLGWATSIEWVVVMSKINNTKGTGTAIVERFALCGNEKSMWGGKEDEQYASFAYIVAKTIGTNITEMLQ